MEVRYLDAIGKISALRDELMIIFDQAYTKTMEDKKAYEEIERLIDQLDKSGTILHRYSKDAIVGELARQQNGKFQIHGRTLSSASYLEAWDDEQKQWTTGSVEAKDGEFYFYNHEMGHPVLYEGMRVRVREH